MNGTLFFSASDPIHWTELRKADLYTNASPVNQVPLSVPGGIENTPFTFGAGARISVFDADAGSATIQVDLTADHGILSLGTTSGLVSVAGNGTDHVMLQGAQDVINTALNGLVFTPESGYLGQANITVLTNDLGHTGSGGASTDLDTVTLSIRPASYYAPFIASGEVPSLATYEGVVSPVFTLTAHDMGLPDLTNVNFVIDGHTIPGDTGDGPLTDVAVAGGTLRPVGYVIHDGNGTYTQQFVFTYPNGPASVNFPYLFKSPTYHGTAIENSNTATMLVGVNNLAPVFSGPIHDQAVFEGKTATVDFTGMFTDVTADTLTYAYQVDGRGWVDLGTKTSFDLTVSGNYTHIAVVRAMDGDGGVSYSNMAVFTPRTLNQTVFEGQTATVDFTGLFTSVPSQTLMYAYQMDGGEWVNLGTNTSFHLTYGDDGVHTGVVAATDQNGVTTTESFTVTVNNLPPKFSGRIADQTVFDGQTAAVNFSGMFSDVPADTMTYAYKIDNGDWVNLGTNTSFSTTVTGIGNHQAVVRATDDDGGVSYSNVFRMTACNLGQVINEGETATINFTGMFTNIPSQTLTYAYQVDGGQWANLGTKTSFDLTYGDDGVHSGVVAAIDEDGITTGTKDFVVTVMNKPPVFSGIIPDQTVYAGKTVTVDFSGMFTDVPADTLTYAYKIGNDGQWVDLGTKTSFDLFRDQIGAQRAAIRAMDGDGGVNYSNVFTITTRNLDQTVFEGQTATVDFTGFFTGAPSPAMTYAYQVDGGQWVSLGTNTSFNLTYGDDGIHTGVVAATDQNGQTSAENFTITVLNKDPVFSGYIPHRTVLDGSTVTVDFTGMFTDVPADTLTYAYQADGGAWINLGTKTSFDLTFQDLGVHKAAVRATDEDGGVSYSNVFTVTLRRLDQTIDEGHTAVVDFTGLFTDAYPGPLTYKYQVDGGAWINLGTKTWFQLSYGDEGVHPGVVAATDAQGVAHTADFVITVNNLPPVFIGNLADRTVYEGQTVTIDFTGMFTDVPADTLTYSYKVDNGAWVNLGTNTRFCLTFGEAGLHYVSVSASDGDGGVAYSRSYSDTYSYTPIFISPVFRPITPPPYLSFEPAQPVRDQGSIFAPSLDTIAAFVEQHVTVDTHRDSTISTTQTGLTKPTETGFTILVKTADGFGAASSGVSAPGTGSGFGDHGSSSGLVSGVSSSSSFGGVTGGSSGGFHSDTYGSYGGGSDAGVGSYGDSYGGLNSGPYYGSSLVPGWSIGDWSYGGSKLQDRSLSEEGYGNFSPTDSMYPFGQGSSLAAGDSDVYARIVAPADGEEYSGSVTQGNSTRRTADDSNDQSSSWKYWLAAAAGGAALGGLAEAARRKVAADPEEDPRNPDISENPNSYTVVNTQDSFKKFDDAIAVETYLNQASLRNSDDEQWATMAEMARKKEMEDRKKRLADLGITGGDSATYEYTMTDCTAYGSQETYYLDGTIIPESLTYITTELITKRTEHVVDGTIEYEYTFYEVSSSYSVTKDKNGFGPVTYLGSTLNSAPLDEESNDGVAAAIDPRAGKVDPTVGQATRIVRDALQELKKGEARTPEEVIQAITEAKEKAKKILNEEIKQVSRQIDEQRSWENTRKEWELSKRLERLEGGLKLIDELCKKALYVKGYEYGRQWTLTRPRDRGPLPSLGLDADYLKGFRDGVLSILQDVRYRQGFKEGYEKFYGKGDLFPFNGDPIHDCGWVNGSDTAEYESKHGPLNTSGDQYWNLLNAIGAGTGETGGSSEEPTFTGRQTRFRDMEITQRDNIFDPNRVDNKGLTNVQRMEQGRAPIGNDGREVQIHHIDQSNSGPLVEVMPTEHWGIPNPKPAEIDRSAFRTWREAYWKWRAQGFK